MQLTGKKVPRTFFPFPMFSIFIHSTAHTMSTHMGFLYDHSVSPSSISHCVCVRVLVCFGFHNEIMKKRLSINSSNINNQMAPYDMRTDNGIGK